MKVSAIRVLEGALGLPCWQVRWDRQVGLDMNFGPPRMKLREPRATAARSARVRQLFARRLVMLRGTHWLVAYPGRWRLALADGLVVRDSSSARRLDMAVARLNGEKLTGIAVHPRTARTEFFFDLGARITVQAASAAVAPEPEDQELWSLHDRMRFVAVFSGAAYSTGSLRLAADNHQPIGTADWLVVARATERRKILRVLSKAAV